MDILKQCLLGLMKKASHGKRAGRFEEVIGHDGIKQIFTKAILSRKPVSILLLGKPASAKTMFLTEIMQSFNQSLFVVGSNTTKAGLLNQLFERRPRYLLIDELEKMSIVDQTALLHLMETGIISETKVNKTRQTQLTSWVFATANSYNKIIQPLLSRFVILEMPQYTFEEFCQISVTRLRKENVSEFLARIIAEKVWNEVGSKDIRDVIKVARLCNSVEDVRFVVKMLNKKYNCDSQNLN